MKVRLFILILALIITIAWAITRALPTQFTPPAESFRLAGTVVETSASISWGSITNRRPKTVQVYKVLPQTFTEEMMTQAMAMAGFTPLTMKLSADKKTMEWHSNGHWRRELKICPSRGWISIINEGVDAQGTNSPEGVPTFERVDELALQLLQQFGGDTNQLSFRPRYRIYQGRETYQRMGGPLLSTNVTMRGCMYARKLDGISFDGKSSRGGLEVEFGDHEKVAKLGLVWRNLQPDKKYRVASMRQIAKFIKAGQARLPEQNFDPRWLESAKKIIINDITLYYSGEPCDPDYYSGEPGNPDRSLAFPYATLRTKVILADSTAVECFLDCPILTKAVDK